MTAFLFGLFELPSPLLMSSILVVFREPLSLPFIAFLYKL